MHIWSNSGFKEVQFLSLTLIIARRVQTCFESMQFQVCWSYLYQEVQVSITLKLCGTWHRQWWICQIIWVEAGRGPIREHRGQVRTAAWGYQTASTVDMISRRGNKTKARRFWSDRLQECRETLSLLLCGDEKDQVMCRKPVQGPVCPLLTSTLQWNLKRPHSEQIYTLMFTINGAFGKTAVIVMFHGIFLRFSSHTL